MEKENLKSDKPTLEILCFGCIGQPGHYLHSKRGTNCDVESLPWGYLIDQGPLLKTDYWPNGSWVESHKEGWTAVSFWDRSGDHRPGSNTSFLVHADIPGTELIELAKQQWPEVFGRPRFPALKFKME